MISKLEQVVFNSDVVNDSHHIYFLDPTNFVFELIRYPLFDNVPLVESVFDARKKITNKYMVIPKVVFIPLERIEEGKFEFICEKTGMQVVYMTPDYLKEHVKPTPKEVSLL